MSKPPRMVTVDGDIGLFVPVAALTYIKGQFDVRPRGSVVATFLTSHAEYQSIAADPDVYQRIAEMRDRRTRRVSGSEETEDA